MKRKLLTIFGLEVWPRSTTLVRHGTPNTSKNTFENCVNRYGGLIFHFSLLKAAQKLMKGIDSSVALSQPSGHITNFRKPSALSPPASSAAANASPAEPGDAAVIGEAMGAGRGKGKGRGRGRGALQNQRTPKLLVRFVESSENLHIYEKNKLGESCSN